VNMAFGPVILVIGMHRSGTSAITRVLNLLGVELGGSLLPRAADNVFGFWEHQEVVLMHERLFSALGRTWFDSRELPIGWLSTPAASEAKGQLKELFTREFGGALVWAVKDPRICRLLPLWRSALEELGVKVHALFMVRHPNEVAQSLQARDGISVSQSRLAWLQHMAEAEISSRGMPRSVLQYDELLAHWASSMGRVAAELGIQWPIDIGEVDAEVLNFLEPAARHFSVAENTSVELPCLVRRVYDAFVSVAHGTGSWAAVSALSDLYDEVAESFLAPLADVVPQAEEGDRQVSEDAQRSMDAVLAKLEVRLAAMDAYFAYDKVVDDVAKLYFRASDQLHTEERAVSVKHDGLGTERRIKFELPDGNKIDFLRFDPSEFSGTFKISELSLDDIALKNIDRHVVAVNQCRLAPGPEGSLRISSADADAYVEFHLGSVGASTGFRSCTFMVRRESLDHRMMDACTAGMESVLTEFKAVEAEGARVALGPLQRSVEDIRQSQAMASKLQSQHDQQLEDLSLGQRETLQLMQALGAQKATESERARLALEPLQRSVDDIRQSQAMSATLQSQHNEQFEDLSLRQHETLQEMRAVIAQKAAESERARLALEPLQRSVEDIRDGQAMLYEQQAHDHQQLGDLGLLLHEAVQQMSILSTGAEAAKSQLAVLVDAHERTLSARWHRWLRKRLV
jgi:hypothetical protein